MKISRFLRRLFCLLLVTLLMVPAALAETSALSSLTDDEILSLLKDVNNEIVSRKLNKTATLPKGAYVAGREIPVGSYIFTCLATGDDWGNLTVYADEGKGSQILWNVISAPDEGEEPDQVFISLNEGDELESGCPFSLTVMTGAIFQ